MSDNVVYLTKDTHTDYIDRDIVYSILDKHPKRARAWWFVNVETMDEPHTAFPVMQPNLVRSDYNPMVNDEMLRPLGGMTEDNTYVLVTLTAAPDPKDTSVNLKAPIVINTDTRRGAQIIVEDDYPVKYKIYDVVKGKKKAEE